MTPENPSKGIPLDALESNEQLLNRTNYLLAIAIDEYKHLPRLFNCVKDVRDLVSVLTDRYLFEKKNITTIFNEKATRGNISNELRNLASKITPNDNLLIYFSGHGEYDKILDQGYWIPVDAEKGNHVDYIQGSSLKVYLNAIKSHHTFLISDSCFSGSLFSGDTGKNITMRYENDASRWGLTAGRNEIVSDGKPGDNSPFAESLLYRLRSNKKPMGVLELCFHVTEYVTRNSKIKQTPVGQPLNLPGHKNGQFVFRLRENIATDEWAKAKSENTVAAYEVFLAAFPKSNFSAEAEKKIELLQTDVSWDEIQKLPESTFDEVNKKLFFVSEYIDRFKTAANREFAEKLKKFLQEKEARLKPKTVVPPPPKPTPKPVTNTGSKKLKKTPKPKPATKPSNNKKSTAPKSKPPKKKSKQPVSVMNFSESIGAFMVKHWKPILIIGLLVGGGFGGYLGYEEYVYAQKRKESNRKADIAFNRIKDLNNLDSVRWFLKEFKYEKNYWDAQKLERELVSKGITKSVLESPKIGVKKEPKNDSEKKKEGQKFHDEMMKAVKKTETQTPVLFSLQVDQQPIFSGCEKVIASKTCSDKNLNEFITKNIKTPKLFNLSLEPRKETVYANFIIEQDGSLSNIFTSGEEKKLFENEVLRVMQLMPKWTPAKKEGKPVRMRMTLPITFKTAD